MHNQILLIEDNLDDAGLAIRALTKSHIANEVIHLEDGQEALNYLFNDQNPIPRLILLDLKMPKVDGIEVLRKLKADDKRKLIPVVVLTSSKQDKDIIESYNLGINAYIVKPVDFGQFANAISVLGLFWMVHNQPPILD